MKPLRSFDNRKMSRKKGEGVKNKFSTRQVCVASIANIGALSARIIDNIMLRL